VEAGVAVVQEGEEADAFYVIARGKVEVVVAAGAGERRLAVLADGDFFGEVALLRETVRSATVRTLFPSLFLVLEKDAFRQLLQEHPALREGVEAAVKARGGRRWEAV